MEIYEREQPYGVVVSMGGQLPNNLAIRLHRAGVRILGTSAESIDTAEDRHKFSALLDRLGIDQPRWEHVTNASDAEHIVQRLGGYPVLVAADGPAAPNARPDISVPSSSKSFIATGAFMRGPLIEPSSPPSRRFIIGEIGMWHWLPEVPINKQKNKNIQVVISNCFLPHLTGEPFQSTPRVRALRRPQVRMKGSRLRHAPAHPCIRHTV